ncbi:MAG: type II toxin-antitoxin system RatA family toxin [Pseudomonadota bacterium]
MTTRTKTTRVPYTAQQMFDLVADVERYPEFLPWCTALRVLRRGEDGAARTLLAEMIVAYKVFRERFKSEVRLDTEAGVIDVAYNDGPFSTLTNQWKFINEEDGGSTVVFYIDAEFNNPILRTLAHTVFEKAFARMSEAFIARADALYGSTA